MIKPASTLCKLLLLLILLQCGLSSSYAENKRDIRTINILTWWRYLNSPEIIKSAEDTCGVKISFDEYYSNDEFLRRWEGQKDFYHVIIFADAIYDTIKNKLPKINSNLFKQSLSYHRIIKQHYNSKKYPHNVVYFFQSLTGFLWNPANISLSGEDTIASIFDKAADKYVVIIDDPVDAWKMTEAGLNRHSSNISYNSFTKENFKILTQNLMFTLQTTTAKYIKNHNSLFHLVGLANLLLI